MDTSLVNIVANIALKVLLGAQTYFGTKWFMVSFDVFPVKTVTKFSLIQATSNVIYVPTMLEPAVMHAPSVEKPLPLHPV